MLPPTHFALGYLFYSLHARGRSGEVEYPVILIFAGSMFPDIIDKPLQLAGVIEWGRAMGHSLLFAIPITVLIGSLLYRRTGNIDSPLAFGLGYLPQPFADGLNYPFQGTLATDFEELSFIVWPLEISGDAIVETISINQTVASIIAKKPTWTATHLPGGEELNMWLRILELCIVLSGIILWIFDGKPGMTKVQSGVSSLTDILA